MIVEVSVDEATGAIRAAQPWIIPVAGRQISVEVVVEFRAIDGCDEQLVEAFARRDAWEWSEVRMRLDQATTTVAAAARDELIERNCFGRLPA